RRHPAGAPFGGEQILLSGPGDLPTHLFRRSVVPWNGHLAETPDASRAPDAPGSRPLRLVDLARAVGLRLVPREQGLIRAQEHRQSPELPRLDPNRLRPALGAVPRPLPPIEKLQRQECLTTQHHGLMILKTIPLITPVIH